MYGSVVNVVTPLGTILLDGSSIEFAESMGHLFADGEKEEQRTRLLLRPARLPCGIALLHFLR